MTVKEAIDILDDFVKFGNECTHPDLPQAVGLAAVVLKSMPENEVQLVDMVMNWKAQDTR